jgi:hypothetical protein
MKPSQFSDAQKSSIIKRYDPLQPRPDATPVMEVCRKVPLDREMPQDMIKRELWGLSGRERWSTRYDRSG